MCCTVRYEKNGNNARSLPKYNKLIIIRDGGTKFIQQNDISVQGYCVKKISVEYNYLGNSMVVIDQVIKKVFRILCDY